MPVKKKTLIVLPLKPEYDYFLGFFRDKGAVFENVDKKNSVIKCGQPGFYAAQSGHGKLQSAVKTRYLLDLYGPFDCVICAGSAGSLVNELRPGDIVLGAETVEFGASPMPEKSFITRFGGDRALISGIIKAGHGLRDFKITKAGIASCDEDVTDPVRAGEIKKETRCSITAWEGAGCAAACRLTKTPFLEIRVRNLATVVRNWLAGENRETAGQDPVRR